MNNDKRRTSLTEENKEYPLPIYDKQDDIYAKAKEEALDEDDDLNAAEEHGLIDNETDE